MNKVIAFPVRPHLPAFPTFGALALDLARTDLSAVASAKEEVSAPDRVYVIESAEAEHYRRLLERIGVEVEEMDEDAICAADRVQAVYVDEARKVAYVRTAGGVHKLNPKSGDTVVIRTKGCEKVSTPSDDSSRSRKDASEGVKTRIRGSRKFSENFSTTYEGVSLPLAAISQEVATESGRKIASDPVYFYQHALAKNFSGERRPKSIAMIEGASDLGSGNHRLFIGDVSGLTVIDEAQGTLNFDYETSAFFPDRGLLPYNRVNHARYRAYSIRSITNGQVPSDRVDGVVPISKDLVAVIQYGNAPGTTPSIVLLDLSVWQQERQEHYIHRPSKRQFTDEPLILHTENPTTKEITTDYYLQDQLGSVTELFSKDGMITGEQVFSSFGKIVHSSGIAAGTCYSYTGREFDKEWGGYFYRARYYDPQTGRFLNEDPRFDQEIFRASPNLYIYVGNNPMNQIDPLGLGQLLELTIAVGIAGIAGLVNALLLGERIGPIKAFAIGASTSLVGIGVASISVAGVIEAGSAGALLLGSTLATGLQSLANSVAVGDEQRKIFIETAKGLLWGLFLGLVAGHVTGAFRHKIVDEVNKAALVTSVDVTYNDVMAFAELFKD